MFVKRSWRKTEDGEFVELTQIARKQDEEHLKDKVKNLKGRSGRQKEINDDIINGINDALKSGKGDSVIEHPQKEKNIDVKTEIKKANGNI